MSSNALNPIWPVRKTSVTKPAGDISSTFASRLAKQPNVKTSTTTTTTFPSDVSTTYNKGTVQQKSSSNSTPPAASSSKQPESIKFNLPPHTWSLPIRPVELDTDYLVKNKKGELVGERLVSGADYENFHGKRRGRIWFYDTGAGISKVDDKGNVIVAGVDISKLGGAAGLKAGSGATAYAYYKQQLAAQEANAKPDSKLKEALVSRQYGFQFMWNPTDINVSVARNMDVTPSTADRLRAVAGAFPGQESISFSITLDRTNDFACAKGMAQSGMSFADMYKSMKTYYSTVYPNNAKDRDITGDIVNLMEQGTMADLEYLFKAINGDSIDGKSWNTYNLLNKQTTDVGYLQPTLLAFQFGPTVQGSLSYVGWISNLTMNHTAFTETMIPLRTTVQFQVDCFAGSQITSS